MGQSFIFHTYVVGLWLLKIRMSRMSSGSKRSQFLFALSKTMSITTTYTSSRLTAIDTPYMPLVRRSVNIPHIHSRVHKYYGSTEAPTPNYWSTPDNNGRHKFRLPAWDIEKEKLFGVDPDHDSSLDSSFSGEAGNAVKSNNHPKETTAFPREEMSSSP